MKTACPFRCAKPLSEARPKVKGSALHPVSYSRLAGTIFAIVAILQLIRALAASPVTIAGTAIPVWASWVAFVIAAALAWIGIRSAR